MQPVTIAILLIIILLAIVGIYYIWTTIQNRAGNAIYIQVVTFEPTKTTIYVQNVGNGTVTIDSVQINDQTFSIQNANCTVASQATTTLQQGQTAEITINQTYTERVHIKVFCKDGTFNENWYQPPST
jgi:archaellum component FlaG (FlaF/FlaG flagellin family)